MNPSCRHEYIIVGELVKEYSTKQLSWRGRPTILVEVCIHCGDTRLKAEGWEDMYNKNSKAI